MAGHARMKSFGRQMQSFAHVVLVRMDGCGIDSIVFMGPGYAMTTGVQGSGLLSNGEAFWILLQLYLRC